MKQRRRREKRKKRVEKSERKRKRENKRVRGHLTIRKQVPTINTSSNLRNIICYQSVEI